MKFQHNIMRFHLYNLIFGRKIMSC